MMLEWLEEKEVECKKARCLKATKEETGNSGQLEKRKENARKARKRTRGTERDRKKEREKDREKA